MQSNTRSDYPHRESSIRGPVVLPKDLVAAWAHPQARAYLQERGLSQQEAEQYDLGYSTKGSMAERIIIPIYGESGELIAFQGRWIKDGEPRYITTGPRPLYCPWDVGDMGQTSSRLVTVEGPFDLYAVARSYPAVVATLGNLPSPQQIQEILALVQAGNFKTVVIWYDMNACQQAYALKIRLHPYVQCVVVESDSKDPGSCSDDVIQHVLEASHGLLLM